MLLPISLSFVFVFNCVVAKVKRARSLFFYFLSLPSITHMYSTSLPAFLLGSSTTTETEGAVYCDYAAI